MTIPRNLSFLAEGTSSTGVLGVANGGTGNVSLTVGYIPYGNGTSAFSSSSSFTYNGTYLSTPYAVTSSDCTINTVIVGQGPNATSSVGMGYQVFGSNTGAANLTGIGYQALFSVDQCYAGATALGYRAGYNFVNGFSATFLGSNTNALASTDNNTVVIGAGATGKGTGTSFVAGTCYNGANTVTWAITSDARIKKNIIEVTNGLNAILALEPVEFDYILEDKHEVGFLAQKYREVLPGQVQERMASAAEKEYTKDEKILNIQRNLDPYFVAAIKEMCKKLQAAGIEGF